MGQRPAPPILLLLALAMQAACSEDPPPDPLLDPCGAGDLACIDYEQLHRCDEDGRWQPFDCEARCQELGAAGALGCTDAVVDKPPHCVCEGAGATDCTEGEARCIDDVTLEVCPVEEKLERVDCNDACAGQPDAPFVLGCGGQPAACQCGGEGTPCDVAEDTDCVTQGRSWTCVDGAWTVALCEPCEGPTC